MWDETKKSTRAVSKLKKKKITIKLNKKRAGKYDLVGNLIISRKNIGSKNPDQLLRKQKKRKNFQLLLFFKKGAPTKKKISPEFVKQKKMSENFWGKMAIHQKFGIGRCKAGDDATNKFEAHPDTSWYLSIQTCTSGTRSFQAVSHPSTYCPGPMLPKFSVPMGTGVSNMAQWFSRETWYIHCIRMCFEFVCKVSYPGSTHA